MRRLLVVVCITAVLATATPAEAHRRTRTRMRVTPTPALLLCIRNIESGNDYTTNTGNGYYGAYQFDRRKWAIWFGNRTPAQVSPAWQDAQAIVLLTQSRKGLAHWPTPNRVCR